MIDELSDVIIWDRDDVDRSRTDGFWDTSGLILEFAIKNRYGPCNISSDVLI